jgi:hypothetical protein
VLSAGPSDGVHGGVGWMWRGRPARVCERSLRESNEAARDLEIAVLRAHPLELEAEDADRRLRRGLGRRRPRPLADRDGQRGQRALGSLPEDREERSRRVARDGTPAGPSSLGGEPAEKAPELGLVDDVYKLGRELVAAEVASFGFDPVEHRALARCKNRATHAQAVNAPVSAVPRRSRRRTSRRGGPCGNRGEVVVEADDGEGD